MRLQFATEPVRYYAQVVADRALVPALKRLGARDSPEDKHVIAACEEAIALLRGEETDASSPARLEAADALRRAASEMTKLADQAVRGLPEYERWKGTRVYHVESERPRLVLVLQRHLRSFQWQIGAECMAIEADLQISDAELWRAQRRFGAACMNSRNISAEGLPNGELKLKLTNGNAETILPNNNWRWIN